MAQPYERFMGASLNPLTRLRGKKLIKHLETVRKKGLNYHPSWCMICMPSWIKNSFFFLLPCFYFSLFMVIRMENSIWQCPLLWEFNDDLTMEMRSQLQSQCSKIWTKIANLGIHITAGVNAIPLVHTFFVLFCFFQNTAMLLMFKIKVSLKLK